MRNSQQNSKLVAAGILVGILLQVCVVTGDDGGPPGWRLPLGWSALGDPGMKSEKVRVAVEGWNFCNRVGYESPEAPSPRWADCTDIHCENSDGRVQGVQSCVFFNLS